MVKYFNKKAVMSLLLSGSIAISMSGCGAKVVSMPSFIETSSNIEQKVNQYEDIESIIEDNINHKTAPEGARYSSAVKVLDSHQDTGEENLYDVMIASGIFHSVSHGDSIYTIEIEDTSKITLATVEIADNQVVNSTTYVEDIDKCTGKDQIISMVEGSFTEHSVDWLKINTYEPNNLREEKYMKAIGTADYVTTATNFKDLIRYGNTICIDQSGNTVKVEAEQKSLSK